MIAMHAGTRWSTETTKDVIISLPVDKVEYTYYAEGSNKVLIRNVCMLGLGIATAVEAQEVIEDVKRQTRRAFSATST